MGRPAETLLMALALAQVTCRASEPLERGPGSGATPDVTAAPVEPSRDAGRSDPDSNIDASAGFPADYCARAGEQPLQVNETLLAVAQGYDESRIANCRTAGLLPPLDQNQTIRWLDYLKQYSRAMAGCPLFEPVPGGILVFGPANTEAALGFGHPPLGREEAELLSEQYVAAFASGFRLSMAERDGVRVHLIRTAEPEIGADAGAALSLCPDAGE